MPGMLAFAAPIVLFLPVVASQQLAPVSPESTSPTHSVEAKTALAEEPERPAVIPFDAWQSSQTARQVRIESRVIIRISPARLTGRQNLLANMPPRERSQRYEERPIGKCLTTKGIAGVQTDRGNRLLLFLRDRRIISVNLEKACRARDFYSGFYVERAEDGQICIDRDKLQSRNGAKCEIDRMRQLVAVSE